MTPDDSCGHSQAAHSRASSIRFALPAIHLYNILKMGRVPALAATACTQALLQMHKIALEAEGGWNRDMGRKGRTMKEVKWRTGVL